MKTKWMVTPVLLAALIAAGCGGKTAETQQPAGTQAPAKQESTTPQPAPTSSAAGKRYTAVASASSASYVVKERFFGKELDATAVGKSSAFTGEIVLDGGVIKPSVIQVDLSTLKSDEDRRDNQVRRALDTAKNQYAIFKITGAEGNPALQDSQEVALKLQGSMTIKGTEKPLVFDAKAKLAGDTLTLTAETTFKMTMFGVQPPNLANFVTVNDDVKLTVTYVGKAQ